VANPGEHVERLLKVIVFFCHRKSDCFLQVLYILQLQQDSEAGTARVSSVSEFLLTQPILSFALLDAGRRRLVKAQEYDAEHAWSCTTGVCMITIATHFCIHPYNAQFQ